MRARPGAQLNRRRGAATAPAPQEHDGIPPYGHERTKPGRQEHLQIVSGVDNSVAAAGTVVEQIEIDRDAMPRAVEDAHTLPNADDDIKKQVHGPGEVPRQLADISRAHARRALDARLVAGKDQAAQQHREQNVDVDPRFDDMPRPGDTE